MFLDEPDAPHDLMQLHPSVRELLAIWALWDAIGYADRNYRVDCRCIDGVPLLLAWLRPYDLFVNAGPAPLYWERDVFRGVELWRRASTGDRSRLTGASLVWSESYRTTLLIEMARRGIPVVGPLGLNELVARALQEVETRPHRRP